MSAAEVATELHGLVMEHGLTVGGIYIAAAYDFSDEGYVQLDFQDGRSFAVVVREVEP